MEFSIDQKCPYIYKVFVQIFVFAYQCGVDKSHYIFRLNIYTWVNMGEIMTCIGLF